MQAVKLRAEKETLPHEDGLRVVRDTAGLGVGVWTYSTPSEWTGRTLPESLARMPMQDGVRLVKCLEGVEGQLWAGGSLTASRWWPTKPDTGQWATFLHIAQSQDGAALTHTPFVEDIAWRTDLPIFEPDAVLDAKTLSPSRVAIAGGFITLCAGLFFGAQWMRYSLDNRQAQTKITQISAEADRVLSNRRQALGNMRVARRFDDLGQESAFLNSFESITQVLKGEDLDVRNIQLRDGEISVRLSGRPKVTETDLVSQLEAMPGLSNVSVTFNNQNNLIVKSTINAPRDADTPSPETPPS